MLSNTRTYESTNLLYGIETRALQKSNPLFVQEIPLYEIVKNVLIFE